MSNFRSALISALVLVVLTNNLIKASEPGSPVTISRDTTSSSNMSTLIIEDKVNPTTIVAPPPKTETPPPYTTTVSSASPTTTAPSPPTTTTSSPPTTMRAQATKTPEPVKGSRPFEIEKKELWPMVNVDGDKNKSKVDVHVPIFFDMTNDKDNDSGKSKLDLSVLSGLVTVNRDKSRQPNGSSSGPITVTVFGIPVYSGKSLTSDGTKQAQSRGSLVQMAQEKIMEEVATQSSQASEPINEYYKAIKKANEKILRTLGDGMFKLSKFLKEKAEPASNTNGPPIDLSVSRSFLKKSNFSLDDFEPKMNLKKFLTKDDIAAGEPQTYA